MAFLGRFQSEIQKGWRVIGRPSPSFHLNFGGKGRSLLRCLNKIFREQIKKILPCYGILYLKFWTNFFKVTKWHVLILIFGTWQWGGFSGILGPLHYVSSRSNFGFQFAEIFLIEKRLPDLPSRGVAKIAYRYNFFQTLNKAMVIVIVQYISGFFFAKLIF